MLRRSANAPGGRPCMLFYVPCTTRFTCAGVKVENEKITIARDLLGTEHCLLYQIRHLNGVFKCYCQIHTLSIRQDAESA